MFVSRRVISSLSAACVSAALSSATAFAALPVTGGPAFDHSGFDGFGFGSLQTGVVPHHRVNDSGLGVASARELDPSAVVGSRGIFADGRNASNGVLRPLSNTPGNLDYQAYAVNRAGTIVGHSTREDAGGGGIRAVSWTSTSATPVELQPLNTNGSGGAITEAYAIANSGIIVGSAHRYDAAGLDFGARAVRWATSSTTPQALAGLVADTVPHYDAAFAVNDAGTTVGQATSGNRYFAARWIAGSTSVQQLGDLGRGGDGETVNAAIDVNVHGTAVGYAERFQPNQGERSLGYRAARWNAGTTQITELNNLGTASGVTVSQAEAVNDAGTTIGFAGKYDANQNYLGVRPTRWNAGSSAVIELGILGLSATGESNGQAMDINAGGTIAGNVQRYAAGALVGSRAVLWRDSAPSTAIDLNMRIDPASGWTLTHASGVSDTGFVTGIGMFDPAGPAAPYERMFTMLVPDAGTYGRGDANFDSKTDFGDLVLLAQHYGDSNTSLNVNVADLDLDGRVEFDDLVILAQNYGSGVPNLTSFDADFAADWVLAQALVPEPNAFMIAATLVAARLLRRYRNVQYVRRSLSKERDMLRI